MNKSLVIVVLLICLGIGYYAYTRNQEFRSMTPAQNVENVNTLGLANPATVFCIKSGGTLESVAVGGEQISMCTFKTGEKCEEWALFRGECKVKGVR